MPNKQIQSLTVEGVTYDIVDNTSGYINAQYIENKTDYSIPVSRVGEIIAGETAIGTDSTNFPTSKAVVDYVDERVVQEIEAIDLSGYATKATTLAGYGITDAKIQNGTITLGSNTITPLTSFTETDPVFSASAAAGITSTDISNWNAKVSDDKTWNGVTLNQDTATRSNYYVPTLSNYNSNTAMVTYVSSSPTADKIVKWDNNSYLYSTTPSANDNSTKVATTAYVDAAIPKVYSSTNTGGYLTMATLPIYDGTVE